MAKFATPTDFETWLGKSDMTLGEFEKLSPRTKDIIYSTYKRETERGNPGRPLERKLIEEMCWKIHHWEKDTPLPPESRVCKVLTASLFSGKSTLAEGSPRRVFIQDLAASLNRKRLLPNERVEEFKALGYEYMKTTVV